MVTGEGDDGVTGVEGGWEEQGFTGQMDYVHRIVLHRGALTVMKNTG